ncbi:hypothetical protein SAMN04488134_101209 [Amphibacillus marinus]|uniref:Uncharacterized protein n=1 Tax=Amphibacillus marinus TaxID=872970 RepID=A0A1H8H199_9BACI|nr:hypothetical protein [Amphibacillus marinus]SEN49258.1 hypothetical protein SAMN04488134_101209 [Amphibacillus marinus]
MGETPEGIASAEDPLEERFLLLKLAEAMPSERESIGCRNGSMF